MTQIECPNDRVPILFCRRRFRRSTLYSGALQFAIARRLQVALLGAALVVVFCDRGSAGTNGFWIRATSGGNWSAVSNWSQGAVADGVDATADFYITITSNETVHLDSPRTIGELIFGTYLGSDSNQWIIDANGNPANVLTLATSSGSPLIQLDNQSDTIGAVLAGTQGFTTQFRSPSSHGTLVLTAANTLSGPITISFGAIQLGNANALQNSTAVFDTNGAITFSPSIGTFTIGGLSAPATFLAGSINLVDTNFKAVALRVGNNNADTSFGGTISGFAASSVTKIGTGTLTLTGANAFAGQTNISGGTLVLSNGNALQNSTLTTTNGLVFDRHIGTFTIGGLTNSSDLSLSDVEGSPIALSVGSNSTNTTYSGVLSGSGSLNKIGGGNLTLTAVNTFSGGLTISGGALTLNSANTFTGQTNLNGGTLFLGNPNALQYSTLNLPTFSGGLASSTSTITLGGLSGAFGSTLSLPNGGTLRVGNNNADTVFSGKISGAGSLIKIGTGSLTVGDAAYSGTTTIAAGRLILGQTELGFNGPVNITGGTLQIAKSLALSNNVVTVNADGGLTFLPSQFSYELGGLSGSGNFALNDSVGTAITFEIDNSKHAATTTFAGTMSGSGSLSVFADVTSTLTLSGANTFTGSTAVMFGTLRLANSDALQNSTFSVNSGEQLSFGASIGTFTLGGLSGITFLPIKLNDTSGAPVTLRVGNNGANTTFSGAINGTGSLVKIGTGILLLKSNVFPNGRVSITGGALQLGTANSLSSCLVAVNTDGGLLFSPSIGKFSISGLSGSNSFSLTDTSGAPITLQLGNTFQTSDSIYGGAMSGLGGLTKIGKGNLTLSGTNTFSGLTTVVSGTVQVTGSLAGNDSSSVFVSAGSDFSLASIVRRVQPGASYAGLGSTARGSTVGLIGSAADIRAGQDNGLSAYDLAMQWRVRNLTDSPRLVSDVMNLGGMSSTIGSHSQTDPYALQMNYSVAALDGDEIALAGEGLINLAWLNTDANQPFGLWQNATTGDFGSGLPGDVFQNVQISWDSFASANSITDSNIGNFLGSYGVDVATHTVWAVVNHNSQFAVVPEPSSLTLLMISAIALSRFRAFRGRRAGRVCAICGADPSAETPRREC